MKEVDFAVVSNELAVSHSYAELIRKFVRWANTRSDIRAAVILGSRARTERPADEWADLDVMMVTTNPRHYIATSEWTAEMGKPMVTFIEETSGGDELERRVLYEGMLDVDFAIFPANKVEQLLKADANEQIPPGMVPELANSLGRGIRVILDKDGLTEKLSAIISSIEQPKPKPPSQDEFLQVVNDFLYHCIWTAKHVMRGELWWALTCLNCRLASLQLRMTEWQARATHGKDYDTWFRGRFLEMWADPKVIRRLKGAFTHYDRNDACTALIASMNLFRQTAIPTAEKLNLQYPTEADKKITEWIKSKLSPDSKS